MLLLLYSVMELLDKVVNYLQPQVLQWCRFIFSARSLLNYRTFLNSYTKLAMFPVSSEISWHTLDTSYLSYFPDFHSCVVSLTCCFSRSLRLVQLEAYLVVIQSLAMVIGMIEALHSASMIKLLFSQTGNIVLFSWMM